MTLHRSLRLNLIVAMMALMPSLIVLKTIMLGDVPTCQSHEPFSAPVTNHHRQVINIITIFTSPRSITVIVRLKT